MSKAIFKLKYNDLINLVDEVSGKRRMRGCIGRKEWKEIHCKKINEHGKMDLKQSILNQTTTLEIAWRKKNCVFVASRVS